MKMDSRITDGQALCRICRDHVPAADVRALVARIQELTGRPRAQIAVMACVSPTALGSVCIPSSTIQQVRRDVYDRLLAIEKCWTDLGITEGDS